MGLTEEQETKWYNYYKYFYFYEDMPFFKFMDMVKAGKPPKRQFVDWSKVKGAYEQ